MRLLQMGQIFSSPAMALRAARSVITDFEEVVRLDTQYINEWSIGLDIKILLQTVATVLKREGSM